VRTRASSGFSLLEVLVAITITVLIIGAATITFIQLLRSHDRAQARVEATANARSAIDALSVELKRAETTGTLMVFRGATETSTTLGDGVNQDNDALTDEEILNGADDDADWQIADDRHAIIDTSGTRYAERPVYYKAPDLDDWQIDVDIKRTSATVEFSTFDVPGEIDRRVRFYLGNDPDGDPNTLMKELTYFDPASSSVLTVAAPVAHNVFSFGLLFWDEFSAHDPASNPWRTEWDDTTSTSTRAPASVYMTISVYAGTPLSLQEVLAAGQQVPTVTLTSIVNIEAVLASTEFRAIKLAYGDIQPLAP
jgi:type II secretory pathway pseudopilin PulG